MLAAVCTRAALCTCVLFALTRESATKPSYIQSRATPARQPLDIGPLVGGFNAVWPFMSLPPPLTLTLGPQNGRRG